MTKLFDYYFRLVSISPFTALVFGLGPIIMIVGFTIAALIEFPITTTAVLIVAFVFWRKHKKSKDEEFHLTLSEINQNNQTNFSHSNSFGLGKALFFDKEVKKFLFIDIGELNSNFQKVVDFSYIKSWKLNWIEQSRNGNLSYSDVVMAITTNDISNPLIKINLPNKATGEKLHATLEILLA